MTFKRAIWKGPLNLFKKEAFEYTQKIRKNIVQMIEIAGQGGAFLINI